MSRILDKNRLLKKMNVKLLQPLLMILFSLMTKVTFADDENALADVVPIVKNTWTGGEALLYIGEGVAALLVLFFTRDVKQLFKVVAVIIFINVIKIKAGL